MCYVSVSFGDVDVRDVAEENEPRGRGASDRKLKVKEEKVKHRSRNESNDLAAGDRACSDSRGNADGHDKQRRRLAERVSIDSFSGETTASGTDGNVENARGPAGHRQKCSTLKVRQEADEVGGDVEQKRQTRRVLSSGQLIKSAWNDVDDDSNTSGSRRKKKRGRNRNVNASTQTTSIDHEETQKLEDPPTHSRRVDKDAGNDRVDREKLAAMIRLLAAPILASEVKTAFVESKRPAGGKSSSPGVAEGRSNPAHDSLQCRQHHHHHHPHHDQDRGPWHQTAAIMARPPAVKISSYDMSRAAGRIPAASASDSTTAAAPDRCPRCAQDRRPKDPAGTASPKEEERTALDQLLAELCRYCDRDCLPGETASQLKAKLKRAVLDKYHRK